MEPAAPHIEDNTAEGYAAMLETGADVDNRLMSQTGLKYKDLVVGKGNAPKEGDIVVSDYKGYVFETGEKWGDSWEEGIPRAARAGATPVSLRCALKAKGQHRRRD